MVVNIRCVSKEREIRQQFADVANIMNLYVLCHITIKMHYRHSTQLKRHKPSKNQE